MARGGLQPRGVYRWSSSGKLSRTALHLAVPNIVGHFLPVLRGYWENYGLGAKCLLVSESIKVSKAMRGYYPNTEFISCDLFSNLMGYEAEDRPHFTWDVCCKPPEGIAENRYDSVICQALLEHVIAPTTAIANMAALLKQGGRLYLQTHTPSFHKHSVPRDYMRFHHDYFEDLPKYLSAEYKLVIALSEMHSTLGVVSVVFTKQAGGES